jgi:antitoxin FitA
MASITIRNLDERTKTRLRLRAARHGHSMEQEARTLLRAALGDEETESGRDLLERIRARFKRLPDIEIPLPPREAMRRPPKLG